MDPSELCAVWGCLHDGYLVAARISERHAVLDVQCPYIAEVLGHPQRTLRITVVAPIRWEPWAPLVGAPGLEDLAPQQADVLSAEVLGAEVGVTLLLDGWSPGPPPQPGGGRLWLQAAGATLGWADGAPLATAALVQAAARYWSLRSAGD